MRFEVGLLPRGPRRVAPGAVHLPAWLDPGEQAALAASCRAWGGAAGGFRSPSMPRGGTMTVGITCLGWHWYPYRYSRTVDDGDGSPVAPFPEWLGEMSRRAASDASALDGSLARGIAAAGVGTPGAFRPDVGLVNWYGPTAKMGMHVDRDERSPAPVVSFSVGDSCVFRFGNAAGRGRPWEDVVLESGDVFVFGGPARLAYHGVPKTMVGTADPTIDVGGRFNVTVRESGLTAPTE
jgi:alkylated DNA repair protein (DNA oxidative demethylase)